VHPAEVVPPCWELSCSAHTLQLVCNRLSNLQTCFSRRNKLSVYSHTLCFSIADSLQLSISHGQALRLFAHPIQIHCSCHSPRNKLWVYLMPCLDSMQLAISQGLHFALFASPIQNQFCCQSPRIKPAIHLQPLLRINSAVNLQGMSSR
jgi:hypothetical protein